MFLGIPAIWCIGMVLYFPFLIKNAKKAADKRPKTEQEIAQKKLFLLLAQPIKDGQTKEHFKELDRLVGEYEKAKDKSK